MKESARCWWWSVCACALSSVDIWIMSTRNFLSLCIAFVTVGRGCFSDYIRYFVINLPEQQHIWVWRTATFSKTVGVGIYGLPLEQPNSEVSSTALTFCLVALLWSVTVWLWTPQSTDLYWSCVFLSASLYDCKRGAYWDRLCRDVVGRWLVGRWLVVTHVHCGQTVHPRPIVAMEH